MNLKEKILYVPGVNGTELLRTMARHGMNTMGLRVMGSTELAEFALMKNGKAIDERILMPGEDAALVYSYCLPDYINSENSNIRLSYTDIQNLMCMLGQVRLLVTDEDELAAVKEKLLPGEFGYKNSAIIDIFSGYLSYLKNNNLVLLDSIGLIRKALIEASHLNVEVATLKEYPLTPLEKKLADFLSCGAVSELTLCDLFGKAEKNFRVADYVEAYGASNEVESIIGRIFKYNVPLDECVIAVSNAAEYGQLFYDISKVYGVPTTFGCGISIMNSNPARVLKAILNWRDTNFGIDGVTALINSDAFDRKKLFELAHKGKERIDNEEKNVLKELGSLRISYTDNSANNERLKKRFDMCSENDRPYVELAARIAGEFQKGLFYIVANYSVIRKGYEGKIDGAACEAICGRLSGYPLDNALDEIIDGIFKINVCNESSREGCLYVTTIDKALPSLRKKLFVAGLSASEFPGNPKENFLFLDIDLEKFGEGAPKSEKVIEDKKNSLNRLLATASALDTEIHLSYSGFNLSEHKAQNPSSVLFELFRSERGKSATMQDMEKNFTHVGFFSELMDADSYLGKAYINNYELQPEYAATSVECVSPVDKVFSPTAIERYVLCPRKFFYYDVMELKTPETDDPFTVMDAVTTGNIAHELMEMLGNNPSMPKKVFAKEAEAAFDRFIATRPPIQESSAALERSSFIEMMGKAYDMDPGNTIIAAEKDIDCIHEESGLHIGGRLDRAEKTDDEKYLIADFKTKKKIEHENDDFSTCIQTLLYAYMFEKTMNVTVDHCEYRYLRQKETIKCKYNDGMKILLGETLKSLKSNLETGNFEFTADVNNCRYCEYGAFCKKNLEIKAKEREKSENE